MSLIGFFDILGTSEKLMAGMFSDTDSLEFVNPVGVAASFSIAVRFAVFSDSLVIAAEPSDIRSLLRAVNFMYGNWFSEIIHVRGGIAVGDIRWVDDPVSDKSFRRCPNLTYARFYGEGLVSAYKLEQGSGPGGICFLTEDAAVLFRKEEPRSVLDGQTPMLCWATEEEARKAEGYAACYLEGSAINTQERRHAAATKYYWDAVLAGGKFLPEQYSVHTAAKTLPP